jgi:hypothetical protein
MKGEQQVAAAWAQIQHGEFMEMLDNLQNLGDAIANLGDAFGSGLVSSIGQAIGSFAAIAKQAANVKTWAEAATVALNAMASAYNSGYQSKSTGKGALQGAASGAAAGSMFGPYGMAAGAIIGAGIGIFGAKKGQAAELKELRAEFSALMAEAQKAGVVLDHAFNPKNAKEYKAAIDEVKKAVDTNAEAHEKLADAAQRYGFTVEELGPAMARQQLDEQMAQIYQDWELLKAAGVDHEAMLERIGPKVGELVNQYVAAGVEIPIAMKPVIDDLYTHGKLVHENGEAYTEAEYNGLSYAQTMSQMFQDLIKHVEDLVAAIRGVPDKTATITVRTVHEGGGGTVGDPPGPEETHQENASGLFMPSASRDGYLKYHRGERIEITPAANSAAKNAQDAGGGGDSGPATIVIPVVIGGQKLDEIIIRRGRAGYFKVPA